MKRGARACQLGAT